MQSAITLGNTKLGDRIHSFSIPALETCPGASGICAARCYARRSFFRMPSVADGHSRNFDFSKTPEFTQWMIDRLLRQNVQTLRIHCAGDFYTAGYVDSWRDIIAASRQTNFFAYTRSWRIPEMLPGLRALGRLPNMSLWYSEDRQTGPSPLDSHIRRAYFAINDADAAGVPVSCDLVFRDNPKTVMKRANGVLVCPTENSVNHPSGFRHTCSTCKLCFTKTTSAGNRQLLTAMTVPLLAPAKKRKQNTHVIRHHRPNTSKNSRRA